MPRSLSPPLSPKIETGEIRCAAYAPRAVSCEYLSAEAGQCDVRRLLPSYPLRRFSSSLLVALGVAFASLALGTATLTGCAQGNADSAGEDDRDEPGMPTVDAAPGDDDTGDGDGDGDCPDGSAARPWYFDADGDLYGDSSRGQVACAPPAGYVAESGDCDDSNRFRNPGAAEVCDGFDNDCNVATEETCSNNCMPLANQGRVYLFCNGVASWTDARSVCIGQGMDLVLVDDTVENDWVSANAGMAGGGEGGVWMRATDQASEGVWQWADGPVFWNGDEDGAPAPGAFARWNRGEPNDAGGEEDCGELVGGGNWNDVPCTANRGFICERN